MISPDIEIEKLAVDRGNILLFVYVSPFCGFAQVALAAACKELEMRCVLFCERDQTIYEEARLHDLSKLAKAIGAEVYLTEGLKESESTSQEYAASQLEAYKVPLGFDCEEFRSHLYREIKLQWQLVLAQVGDELSTLWLPVGSGTLVSVFRQVFDSSIPIRGINVNVLELQDVRIQRLTQMEGVSITTSTQKFRDRADRLPPIDSNLYYDAKLWSFICSEGVNGDVWWNVAK